MTRIPDEPLVTLSSITIVLTQLPLCCFAFSDPNYWATVFSTPKIASYYTWKEKCYITGALSNDLSPYRNTTDWELSIPLTMAFGGHLRSQSSVVSTSLPLIHTYLGFPLGAAKRTVIKALLHLLGFTKGAYFLKDYWQAIYRYACFGYYILLQLFGSQKRN